jgi:hypothetical protein
VRLTSGEVARVHQLTDQPLAPIVRTETASGGEDLRTGDAETLDLRESFGQNRLRIDGMLLDAEI